ncbi:hypothetical protein GCM10011289_02240 [Paludibacterium paludis]|uniref:Uncharacterized protein n=1 Tax=Paludibacterium paludis TaxID=1225769 RepID=A0A918NWX9_9NEIS|nr:hypothetical protein GCM10011289_02240 [Paludibacterium paludis]
MLAGLWKHHGTAIDMRPARINGMTGRLFLDRTTGRIAMSLALGIGPDGLIHGLCAMRNPDKLPSSSPACV